MSFIEMNDFILDPFSELHPVDTSIFEENVNSTFNEEILIEAFNTKKKNVFQKIWDIIKKVSYPDPPERGSSSATERGYEHHRMRYGKRLQFYAKLLPRIP